MKMQLGRTASNIFVVCYIGATLYMRFLLEPQLHGNWVVSVALGGFALLFLWALQRSGFINPWWNKG